MKIDAELTHLAPKSRKDLRRAKAWQPTEPSNSQTRIRPVSGYRYARGRTRTDASVGYVEISGTDIPLHEQLVAGAARRRPRTGRSLQPKVRSISVPRRMEDLGPASGRGHARNSPQGLSHSIHAVSVSVAACARPRNGARTARWTLNDIEARGSNDSTIVKCRGEAIPHDSGCEADLTFEATNVPLDDNLKLALSSKPAAQQAWDELRPQGASTSRPMLHDSRMSSSQTSKSHCGRARTPFRSSHGCFRID